jgi:1-acyl-sn-glycerol-3-phosphate acyltransferase
MKVSKNLLRDLRFSPLFWTQFFGAFNDNIFKNALVIFITMRAFSLGSVSSEQMVAVCGGVFILPFFLFSATAGQVADKFSKSRLVTWVKIWEILVMVIGGYGFVANNVILLLVTLFFMGMHSAFFGPVKYSILPQLLRREELVAGNAYVEMGTFLAILLGTILGGALIAQSSLGSWLVGVVVLTVAVLGWYSSLGIVPLTAVAPALKIQINPFPPTWDMIRRIHRERSIFLSILGISWFWFFGAGVLSVLPAYCRQYLHGSEALITLFLALFSVGIGIGSLLCGQLSAHKLELGLVPFGSIGISLFCFDLFWVGCPASLRTGAATHLTVIELLMTAGGLRIATDLLCLAIFGGFFIVPLYTLMQQRSEEGERSRIIAGNNILNALFMVIAAVLLVVLFRLQFSIPQIFLLFGLLNLAVAVYIYTRLPEFLFRFLCWSITNIMYRLRVVGREHLPLDGPALLVCNHVSFVDWLIIASVSPRPVCFVMHYSYLEIPLTSWIFRDTKVIAIAGSLEDSEIPESAFERIDSELQKGQLVCLFPEGRITTDGGLGEFRPDVERILRETPVPLVPLMIDGLGGSLFSKGDGQAKKRLFRRIWARITMIIGPAVPPEQVSAPRLQPLVAELQNEAPE